MSSRLRLVLRPTRSNGSLSQGLNEKEDNQTGGLITRELHPSHLWSSVILFQDPESFSELRTDLGSSAQRVVSMPFPNFARHRFGSEELFEHLLGNRAEEKTILLQL